MKTNQKNIWRLPTKEEFENVLYPNQDKIPNLDDTAYYWSSSEYDSNYAWTFYFNYGLANNLSNKYSTKQVRAVRNVSNYSTNSSNSTIVGNLEIYNADLGSMTYREAKSEINKLNKN